MPQTKTYPLVAFKPPELRKQIVYVGAYGGHFDIIVLFKNKPRLVKDEFDQDAYCPNANRDKLLATIDSGFWAAWFDVEVLRRLGILNAELRPHETYVQRVKRIMIELPVDENGDLVGLNFDCD